ncbi:lantibiotic dehydratase [Streptomyces sp. NPDC020800]|uniref:lantibiotic dehydratase n=1 Tax=Streptomyces sp. NPDC020800 TaxID=3365092 RepID=UPI0037A2FE22
MSTTVGRPRFTSAGPVMIRAVSNPDAVRGLPPVPSPDAAMDEVCGWIRRTWAAAAELQEAVRHASPSLARGLDGLTAGGTVDPGRARRMLLALTAYCHRAQARPAPFGLFAGVLEGHFDAVPMAQWGDEHRAVARADSRWLVAVVDQLEALPSLRRRLWLMASNVAVRRAGRLVLPWRQRSLEAKGTEVYEVSLRLDPEVRALMDLAAAPVPYAELLHKLEAEHPEHSEVALGELIDALIAQRVLVTSLQPPSTEVDALGYVLGQLDRAGAHHVPEATELTDALGEVHRLMEAHNEAFGHDQEPLRAEIRERMLPLVPGDPKPAALDTLLEGTVVLPLTVAAEAERAAETLARISPDPYGHETWRAYRARFLDRYGPHVLVPLLELTGPAGVGLPDGYHGTPTVGTTWHGMSPRDSVLLAAAQQAVHDGEDLVLDETMVERLAVGDPAALRVPPHLELLYEVRSPSLVALRDGHFDLDVRIVSRGWSHLTGGRFAALLSTQPASPLLEELARRPTSVSGALPAQLAFPGLSTAGVHLTRTPQLAPAVISLSEHREPAGDVIDPSDLAVMCDGQTLHLVSRSRRQVIEAGTPHQLQIECQTPAIGRFLDELVRGQAAWMTGPAGTLRPMHWGAARHLAALPRTVSGKSVLSPAMWRLTPDELPGDHASIAEWEDALAVMLDRRRIPYRVFAERWDQRLLLDLNQTADRALLREQTSARKYGPLRLIAAPAVDAHGWAGRPVEVVTLLRATGPARPAPDLRTVTEHRPVAGLVGTGRYLQARLHGPAQGRRDLLVDHLPALAADLGDAAWWIRPHDGTDPFLELTVRVGDLAAGGAAAGLVGAWAGALMESGALRDVVLVPYRPHSGRWGEGPLLEAAETVMAADTAVVADQAAARPGAEADPRVDVVAGLLAITEGVLGSRQAGHAWWIAQPQDTVGGPLPRDVQQRLRRRPDVDRAQHPHWVARRDALGAYAQLLRAAGIDTDRVLDELLHEHCLRTLEPGPGFESMARRLARAQALTARATNQSTTPAPPT